METKELKKILDEFGDKVKYEYDLKKKKLVQHWWKNKSFFQG